MTDRNETGGIQDLVDNTWDACDDIFEVNFHNKFHSSIEDYFNFLTESFRKAILMAKIGGILKTNNVDRLLLHFATQRISRDRWDSWSRLNFDLTQIEGDESKCLDNKPYYADMPIKQHVFQKAKGNQTLCFEFVVETAEMSKDHSFLQIPEGACDILLRNLDDFNKWSTLSHRLEVAQKISTELEECEKNGDNNSGFLNALKQICKSNLLEDLSQPEQITFLIESSLITLTLLKDGSYPTLPRSFLLVPVFVGSIRLGGIAFFSNDSGLLRENSQTFKQMARNLLTNLGIMESRETEFDKRRLEANSPIIHLFVHSFNKAFTTPILNICDELKDASGMLINPPVESAEKRDAKKLGYRLDAIETFLRSYSKRFNGTFAALASQPLMQNGRGRFLELQDFDGKQINNELSQQIKSLYAVLLANDVFDCTDFASYQAELENINALEKIVDLRIELKDRIPAQRDVFMLHLISLVQNSIEALPFGQVLRSFKDSPSLLSSHFWIRVSSREDEGSIIIEVSDNGTGFDENRCSELNKYLQEFSSVDHFPPSVIEIRSRPELEYSTLSTKSGSALGQGIFGFAEYLSCICRVEGLTEEDHPRDDAKILMRGSIQVISQLPKNGTKSTIRVSLPKLNRSNRQKEVPPERKQGVFLERRD